jgi:pimeloyl-ACP methyl ester carboxylesterase
VPGLLAPVVAAYAQDGVAGFGTALYGSAWDPAMAPQDPEAVRRDLAMFRAFEPVAVSGTGVALGSSERVTTTVGELSPPVRYRAARALRARCGLPYQILDRCGHAAHLERPDLLAALAGRLVDDR